ncbi:hypothetical protein [Marinobacterium sediminicola]|uniref:Na+/H+ antiporter NhaD/arsenite permease-like protein n=1 Tax=Marinobacterium sediminicola TaxID=518898 RepID=A0ABY1S2R4_9GAMM|nr:hypothetical protein [Marinobacterium sediminicola]ULG68457.1 hypothetical protein LN244_12220 [Marinobacterium sediminicola]SMR76792.1 hypothetical protein SAMN04487964_112103 [Marinobacterium sediminicola]
MTVSTTAKSTFSGYRDALSGLMIFLTLLLALLDTFQLADTAEIATVCAWTFVALEFSRLTPKQRLPIYLLLGGGCGFIAWAWHGGAHIQPLAILGEHLKLAMLLAAVNFIRLSTRLEPVDNRPGARSFVTTLAGMHVLSSVANFSSMLLVGEQLKRKGTLSSLSQIILARGFSLAILWSPFLSILPLVLEQVPGTELYAIYPYTLALALLGLIYTLIEARHRYTPEFDHYQGYPMTGRSLMMPACLIAAILLVSGVWPELPTVGVVAVLAVLTPVLLLTLRQGPAEAASHVCGHVLQRLADTRGEVTLFLSAGFLAAGVKACIGADLFSLPFAQTDATVAILVMWSIVGFAFLGIHQFALVATCAGLLADVTTAPTLMAIAYIIATSVSMSGSLFSGVNFILQARFNCSGRTILRNNLAYSVLMLTAASVLIYMLPFMGIY